MKHIITGQVLGIIAAFVAHIWLAPLWSALIGTGVTFFVMFRLYRLDVWEDTADGLLSGLGKLLD